MVTTMDQPVEQDLSSKPAEEPPSKSVVTKPVGKTNTKRVKEVPSKPVGNLSSNGKRSSKPADAAPKLKLVDHGAKVGKELPSLPGKETLLRPSQDLPSKTEEDPPLKPPKAAAETSSDALFRYGAVENLKTDVNQTSASAGSVTTKMVRAIGGMAGSVLSPSRSLRRTTRVDMEKKRRLVMEQLELTRDHYAKSTRSSALRFLEYTLKIPIKQVFRGQVQKQFLQVLTEICAIELSFRQRRDELQSVYFMTASASKLGSHSSSDALRDFKTVVSVKNSTVHVALKLAAISYLWMIQEKFPEAKLFLGPDFDIRGSAASLAEMTRPIYPFQTRQTALTLLWKFENLTEMGNLQDGREGVTWMNILELSRNAKSIEESLVGLRYVLWFSLLPSWEGEMRLAPEYKRKVGDDLIVLTKKENKPIIRRQSFALIHAIYNHAIWKDMFDKATHDQVCIDLVDFCRTDTSNSSQSHLVKQIEALPVTTPEVAISRRIRWENVISVVTYRHTGHLSRPLVRALHECEKKVSADLAMEHVKVFIFPGESILDQSNLKEIYLRAKGALSDQDSSVAKEIALQAVYFIAMVQNWFIHVGQPEGPLSESI